jgi:hypothetical protein
VWSGLTLMLAVVPDVLTRSKAKLSVLCPKLFVARCDPPDRCAHVMGRELDGEHTSEDEELTDDDDDERATISLAYAREHCRMGVSLLVASAPPVSAAAAGGGHAPRVAPCRRLLTGRWRFDRLLRREQSNGSSVPPGAGQCPCIFARPKICWLPTHPYSRPALATHTPKLGSDRAANIQSGKGPRQRCGH